MAGRPRVSPELIASLATASPHVIDGYWKSNVVNLCAPLLNAAGDLLKIGRALSGSRSAGGG